MKAKKLVSGIVSAVLLLSVSSTALAAGGRHCHELIGGGVGAGFRAGCHDFNSMVPVCSAPNECYGGKRGCIDEDCDGICDNWQAVCGGWADGNNDGVCDNYDDCGNYGGGNYGGNYGGGHHSGGHHGGGHC